MISRVIETTHDSPLTSTIDAEMRCVSISPDLEPLPDFHVLDPAAQLNLREKPVHLPSSGHNSEFDDALAMHRVAECSPQLR